MTQRADRTPPRSHAPTAATRTTPNRDNSTVPSTYPSRPAGTHRRLTGHPPETHRHRREAPDSEGASSGPERSTVRLPHRLTTTEPLTRRCRHPRLLTGYVRKFADRRCPDPLRTPSRSQKRMHPLQICGGCMSKRCPEGDSDTGIVPFLNTFRVHAVTIHAFHTRVGHVALPRNVKARP